MIHHPPLPFQNQEQAFNQVTDSIGRLVVLDALPGYGKTAFLEKLQRTYQSPDIQPLPWSSYLLNVGRERTAVDLILAILEALGGETHDHNDRDTLSEFQALMQLRRLQQWEGQGIALFLDDVHGLNPEALMWLRCSFCQDLKSLLGRATQGQFLLVIAGRNLRKRGEWPGDNYVYLTPFQRLTLGQALDHVHLPQLQNQLNIAAQETRKLFINRIYRLTGGHPRSSINLIRALQGNQWEPETLGILMSQIDLDAFQNHVAQELKQITTDIEEIYTQYFPALLVFRMLNSTIIKAIRQKQGLDDNTNSVEFIQALTTRNLALKPRHAPSRLNPVLRHGYLAKLMLSQHDTDLKTYQDLHRFAQDVYQNLCFTASDPEQIQGYMQETLYHDLCIYTNDHSPALIRHLCQGLQALTNLYGKRQPEDPDWAEEPQNPRAVLTHLIQEDPDIQALLDEHKLQWDREVVAVLNALKSAPQGDAIQPAVGGGLRLNPHARNVDRAKAITLALLTNDRKVKGTGFWMDSGSGQPWVMTCAHVIKAFQDQQKSQIWGRTFGPEPQELQLEVVWYQPPPNIVPNQWNASQDVAVLRPCQPELVCLPDSLLALNLSPNPYAQSQPMSLYSFGFPSARDYKGEAFSQLTWEGSVSDGFAKLVNLGTTKVEGGVSGSPLVDLVTQQVVGMIQARFAGDVIYCIPAPSLVRILDILNNQR